MESLVVTQQFVEIQRQDIAIGSAITEYRKGPFTPELINNTWQILWKTVGERKDHIFEVPTCDRTKEELSQLQKEGKEVLLIPDEFYTQKGLILLGEILPGMQSRIIEKGAKIINETSKGGCIDVEMDSESPNRNTTEEEAVGILKAQGRIGQRLATFIIGSWFNRLVTGVYFDEQTWSRLPGSQINNSTLEVYCSSYGKLFVHLLLNHSSKFPSLGVRSEGRKKAY